MHSLSRYFATATALLAAFPAICRSQTFDAIGTRAAGMSGAFVAVADDASAAYWNPAGFASGSFFSLALDRTSASTDAGEIRAGSRSGWLLALGAPALGLSYYRLRGTVIEPATPTAEASPDRNLADASSLSVRTLVSHHAGATLVQSIAPGVAVGATLKLVRGIAAADVRAGEDRESLLDDGGALLGRGSSRFDADLGIMATFGRVKGGLTVRNLTQPEFDTTIEGQALTLERQVRAGIAFVPVPGWTLAADADLVRTTGISGGEARDVAFGGEGRVARRIFVRAGTRFNTAGDGGAGRSASVSAGASYAVTASVMVDGHVTSGAASAGRGWGIAARFVY